MEATIVSVYPFLIDESKPGLNPGRFIIPAAKEGDFETLIINDSRFAVYMDADRGSLWIPHPGMLVAKSIVEDFIPFNMEATMETGPGVFYLEGALTKLEVMTKHKARIDKARESQNRWFEALVILADNDWNKYHRHSTMTDVQRFAAKKLGLKRDWLITKASDVKNCPACMGVIPEGASICQICRVIIDPEKAKKFQFANQ
jgi:hypothetical protein